MLICMYLNMFAFLATLCGMGKAESWGLTENCNFLLHIVYFGGESTRSTNPFPIKKEHSCMQCAFV